MTPNVEFSGAAPVGGVLKGNAMELITIWQAHGDGGNEYSAGPVIAYCSTKDQADQAANGRGWYGGNGVVVEKAALRIDGKVWVLAEREPIDLDSEQAKRDATLRNETLAMLTAEQRRVLGLPTPNA